MSSNTIERPEDGTIEELTFDASAADVTTYLADSDKALVLEIEPFNKDEVVRVYVNGVQLATTKVVPTP